MNETELHTLADKEIDDARKDYLKHEVRLGIIALLIIAKSIVVAATVIAKSRK